MADIKAKDVAELRKKTGCGMMECKKALVEAEGDFDVAVKVLREKGLAVAAKKADRIAAEGLVDIMLSADGKTAAMIEVNAETDFVAKNETFVAFVKDILKTILAKNPANVEELLKMPLDGSEFTVEAALKDKIFTIGENMNIRRFVVVTGNLSTYIHGHGTTGVIVNMNTDVATAAKPEFAECAKNVALQVAAMSAAYLNKEDVPASVIEDEKAILIQQIKNDEKNASKPDAIIEKMVLGKVGKYYENNCLVCQSYVKDDKMTVGKYVESVAKELGTDLTIAGFVKFEKGEGLQKREDDLAAEVDKLVNGK